MLFQSSKLEGLFSLKRGKRDVRALSFELSKMSPQVGLAVLRTLPILLKGGLSDPTLKRQTCCRGDKPPAWYAGAFPFSG